MVNAQEWLDENYPLSTRANINILSISFKNLIGELKLDGFVNLTRLDCYYNKLTNLDLSKCSSLIKLYCYRNQLIELILPPTNNLQEIYCYNNLLTNLDWSTLNRKKLIVLSLLDNNFTTQDLSCLIQFTQLKGLCLGALDKIKINQGIYNRFTGSLEYLTHCTKLKELDISNTDIDSGWEYLPSNIKIIICSSGLRPSSKLTMVTSNKLADLPEGLSTISCQGTNWVVELANYKEGNYYNYQTWRKNFQPWKDQGFVVQHFYQWINAGAKINDHEFVAWLRDIKKETPEWITNYKEDYQILSDRFKKYGLCSECNQPHTGEQWCQPCNATRLQQDFANWTSHNPKVDEFIKQYQLSATDANKFLEWIPYEQFTNIEYLAEGGFGKVYKANWTEGNIHHWDQENKQWNREKDNQKYYREIVLKILTNSQDNNDFLQEAEKHKIIDDWFNNIVPCYGLSQDPEGNYLMVMQYLPEGNLRQYLSKNNKELKGKLAQQKELNQEFKKLELKIKKLEEKQKELEKNLSQQIRTKILILEELTNSIKDKLKSKSKFSETKQKAREEKLEAFFGNFPTIHEEFIKELESIKPNFSEKLTKEEIDKLCQTKLELVICQAEKQKLLDEFLQEATELNKSLQEKQQELKEFDLEIISLQRNKFNQLVNIARGLKDIHQKNLVHHDFHSGNILKGIKQTECLITDLGLCKPANETNEEKIFGVLPYVAPEVLQSHPYTQKSDIYSFGIIAYEMFSGLPPYYDRVHDVSLGVAICQGLRPKLQIKIPQLLEDLINQCWNKNPTKRPTANDLEKTLRNWQSDQGFIKQLQEAEKHNKNLPEEVRFPNYQIHHGAVYHSKLLPTKEITQLMQNFNLQLKTKELNTHLIQVKELTKEITVEQKYHDLKKALKLVFEKSEELEKIAISEEMKEALTKIKELKHKSQEKDSIYQELATNKSQKEQELIELKKTIITNNKVDNKIYLSQVNELLKKQEAMVKNNNNESVEELESTKGLILMLKIISEVEINQLCQKQIEITELVVKLEKITNQEVKQLTQIINNIGSINVQQGNAIIGNNIGDSANFTYNANMEIPPK